LRHPQVNGTDIATTDHSNTHPFAHKKPPVPL
jgi:hypothetical protein